jgi:hypothetical protein
MPAGFLPGCSLVPKSGMICRAAAFICPDFSASMRFSCVSVSSLGDFELAGSKVQFMRAHKFSVVTLSPSTSRVILKGKKV